MTALPPVTNGAARPVPGAAAPVMARPALAPSGAASITRTHVADDVFVAAASSSPVARSSATSATSATSASLPPLPSRRLPALRDALVDPSLPALPFSSVAVPPDVLRALQGARRVLVVGHVPPDGDCVGSAAGLVAALRAVGKDAVAVVDDALPAASRAIDEGGAVRRAADAPGAFDLVVLVDVAQPGRIGGAAAFIARAEHVLVVDHHEDVPDRARFGVRDEQAMTSWIAPSADAAAVLVGGIAAALGDDAQAAARAPLAAAMYTDTLGFRAPGADRRTLQLFKGVVGDGVALDALEHRLRPQLPASAAALVDAQPVQRGPHAVTVTIDAATWSQLQTTTRAADPRMTDGDIRGVLCDRLDALRDEYGAAMLLIDEGAGVRLSARSVDDGFAREVAEKLGGGGHGRAAGGFVARPFADVADALGRALDEVALAKAAKRRAGRL